MAKVLLIDDDENVRYALAKYMTRAKHEVIEADDGQVGLNFLNKHQVDIVVTDILMPGMDGIQTLFSLSELDEAPPVIAISGGGRICADDYLQTAKALGAQDIFQKPLDEQKLVSRIEELTAVY